MIGALLRKFSVPLLELTFLAFFQFDTKTFAKTRFHFSGIPASFLVDSHSIYAEQHTTTQSVLAKLH